MPWSATATIRSCWRGESGRPARPFGFDVQPEVLEAMRRGLGEAKVEACPVAEEGRGASGPLRPDEAETHNNLGAALADQGLLEAAIMSYREALRLLPEYADAFYNLGNALRLSGRYAEAVACYGQALRLRPGSTEAHNNLGTALLRLGRLSESITSLREALRLRPGYTLALINLGLALAESGRLAE
ncbi:MAG: tetratricopeptide repeat protein, partial [Planctomycetaceae bacterium]|nr:tetratricopeptide repeat protein [Planctomycetaceae bacterium]